MAKMHKVCDACSFGKESKVSFTDDKQVSKNTLKIVHSNVWDLMKIDPPDGVVVDPESAPMVTDDLESESALLPPGSYSDVSDLASP